MVYYLSSDDAATPDHRRCRHSRGGRPHHFPARPRQFTLADIGGEVGLSAAALVRRFGSKRGLMLALARSARDSVDACFDAVRAAANPSPLAALLVAATEMTRYVKSPEEMSNHLAFLQTNISNPDFYAVMLENARLIIAGYRRLLDEAVASGESWCGATRRGWPGRWMRWLEGR